MRLPRSTLLAMLALFACLGPRYAVAEGDFIPAPDWAKRLVIYEIATKGFTSPNGPESGTFASLRERLPYLQRLGVTGIWVTGYSLSDAHHFYNIWTQYAVIDPGALDPSLGTPQQFKSMIDEAHRHGIKVFLDVVTHGVMPGSPLLRLHPDWFRGGSWGMVDYDWQGGHIDLDDWWVQTWTRYVTEFGVDGFRLDIEILRPDLWARIRRNVAIAKHPIVVFAERTPVIPGVTDFTQAANAVRQVLGNLIGNATTDLPDFYAAKTKSDDGPFHVEIGYADGSKAIGSSTGEGPLSVAKVGFSTNKSTFLPHRPAGQSVLALNVGNVADRPIKTVIVERSGAGDPADNKWSSENWMPGTPRVEINGTAPQLRLFLGPFQSESPSVELSCHDYGWQGSAKDKNQYGAQGSRAIFGYTVLFTPKIPIFMSGEEFDAGFHALPNLSPSLFGGANPGKGRWLYGNQLDWAELSDPRHKGMLDDVARMIQIRKSEDTILGVDMRGEIAPALAAVPYKSDIEVPAPYMRWSGTAAIIIAANLNAGADAHLKLSVPLEKLGGGQGNWRVTDLWNAGSPKILKAAEMADFPLTILRDKSPTGGLGVIKIERLPQ